MPCQTTKTNVLIILIEVLRRYVPDDFVVTGDTPIGDLPISSYRLAGQVFAHVVTALKKSGCCLKSLNGTGFSKPKNVGALAKAIFEDLRDCPQAESAPAKPKKRKKPAKKED